jgi:outer membrane protein assembly factor BamB
MTEGGGALWFSDTNALVFRLGPTDPSAPAAMDPRFVDTTQSPGLDHGPLITTPVEHDGQAIVVDGLGGIVSLDPTSGATHPLGQYDTAKGAVRTEPVVAGDLVLTMIGTDLQAFDLTTGRLKWTASGGGGAALSGQVASSTTAYFVTADLDADGNVVFDTTTGQLSSTLRAVDLESGDTRWTAPVASVQGVGIAVAGDEVVAAGAPLTAFDGETGAVRWTAADVVRSQGAPGFDVADNVVIADTSDEVVAVDATSGAVRWRSPIAAPVLLDTGQPVFIDDGTVVVATASPGPILGFDVRTGGQLWSFTAPSARYGTVLSADGATYLVLTDGSVLALSSKTGKIVGSSNVVSATLAAFGQSVARPAVIGDTVVVEEGAFLVGLVPAATP